MRTVNSYFLFTIIIFILLPCCKDESEPITPDNKYNETDTLPHLITHDYIELEKIERISKFRSSVGHSYWDDFESCRSLKHYFQPNDTVDWSSVKIFSPFRGIVSRIDQEWAGTQVRIQSKQNTTFMAIIFHINLSQPLNVGDSVTAGQLLGSHIGSQTMSDIAIGFTTSNKWKVVSYFDVMTDSVFQHYQARGINQRGDAIISKQARDADTLQCNGETFQNNGTIENWIQLN